MRSLDWFELRFPAGLQTEAAIGLVRSLSARGRAGWLRPKRPLIFELRASRGRNRWLVGLPTDEAKRLRARIEDWLPGVAVLPLPDRSAITETAGDGAASELAVLAVELRLRSQRRPLRAELQPEISRGLLGGLQGLRGQEQVVVQWVVGGWLPRSAVPPASEQGEPPTIWNILSWGVPRLDSEQIVQARKKQAEQLFACVGRVAVSASTDKRRFSLTSRVVGVYQVLRVSGAGLSRRSLPSWWVLSRMRDGAINQIDPPCVLRADELVAVLGWPVGLDREVQLPGVELNQSRLLRPDRRVLRPKAAADENEREQQEGVPKPRIVAESAYPSAPGRLVLPEREALRHLHVLGPTGVGKSTLLAKLILQDITAHRGVVVVDPKGDLVDDVLVRLPASALERVAVLDPTDPAPLGLNPLRAGLGGSAGVGIDGLLGVLHSLWASSWGPRLHDVLHAGLLTLAIGGGHAEDPDDTGHTLVELPLLLTNPAFRRPLVARAVERDPLGLAGFWAWFDALSEEQAAQVLGPVMNKLRAFVLRPDLRAVLGQIEPRFEVSEVFKGGKALLVRLPKGQLGGEAAALLGSLVVQQVWQATLARAVLPAQARRPVFVYLDEFQEVVRLELDLGDALAEARGMGVGLVLSHQHLGQLGSGLRSAVLANAGSRVAFRLDHEDGSVIARRSGGKLQPEDFSALPPYEAYVDLIADGAARGFASARTAPLGSTRRSLSSVRAANRKRVGLPRASTEQRLRRLLDGPASKQASGWAGAAFGVVPTDESGSGGGS